MAGLLCCAQTNEVALLAGAAKTVLQVTAPAHQRLKVRRWGVFFDGIDPAGEPVQVRLLRQGTAGSMTGLTPVKLVSGSETVQTTAAHSATAEPSAGDVVDVVECHPQTGFDAILPPDQVVEIPGGTRIGVECTAPAAVNVRAKIWFEE